MSTNRDSCNESIPSLDDCHNPIRPAGFTDETAAEFEAWLEDRRANAASTEDEDADLRAATAHAEKYGLSVWLLTCEGFTPTFEAASNHNRAMRRAIARGWARAGGIVSGKLIASYPRPIRIGFDDSSAA